MVYHVPKCIFTLSNVLKAFDHVTNQNGDIKHCNEILKSKYN